MGIDKENIVYEKNIDMLKKVFKFLKFFFLILNEYNFFR